MFWILIVTITALVCLVAFETAFRFALTGEYSAVSGTSKDAHHKIAEYRLRDSLRLERQNSAEQTVPNFDGDDLY